MPNFGSVKSVEKGAASWKFYKTFSFMAQQLEKTMGTTKL